MSTIYEYEKNSSTLHNVFFTLKRNIANLAKSMEANWDSVANCDGTPLDDEDAGNSNKMETH